MLKSGIILAKRWYNKSNLVKAEDALKRLNSQDFFNHKHIKKTI